MTNCQADQKIVRAVEKDECLQQRIKAAVIAAIERELAEANVIDACDDDVSVGCVSVLFSLVCTC